MNEELPANVIDIRSGSPLTAGSATSARAVGVEFGSATPFILDPGNLIQQSTGEQAPVTTSDSPYDTFSAINEARREAREHTDTMASELRNIAREDRQEIQSTIATSQREIMAELAKQRETSVDEGKTLARLDERVGMLQWIVVLAIAVMGLILGILQFIAN